VNVIRFQRGGEFLGGTAVAVRNGMLRNHVDLSPFDLITAIWICISTGNSEVLLAAVYKPPGKTWSDADVINLLNLRNKSLLASNLNSKNPVWKN
jgi:hypothetical protein